MHPIAKTLIGLGIVLVILGLLWQLGVKFTGFGRLPGDIAIEKPGFSFYFPVTSSLFLSVFLSVILYLLGKWNR